MKFCFYLKNWEIDSDSIKFQKGVYKIIATNKHFIARLKGKDYDCILYIGSSSNLKQRLSYLYNSIIKKRSSSHSLFKLFNNTFIEKIIPLKFLKIEILYDDDHGNKEDFLLKKYLSKFSELPPLNHKVVSWNDNR